MNQFGGNWTEAKMQIVIDYAYAYLTIMNKQSWAKTLYFDGFAGSGRIEFGEKKEPAKGFALRILEIVKPNPFDLYYFVEKNEAHAKDLQTLIETYHADLNTRVVNADCNVEIKSLAAFLKKNKQFRALFFIDPYGMAVNWSSIESLRDLGVDLWILVPTGMGVNRLLKTDGNISDSWVKKLESFLGIPKEELFKYFYKSIIQNTLFGEETKIEKETLAIKKCGELYNNRLKDVFKFVSDSFVMKNSNNAIMYHFMMATNNRTALKIANDIIKPKYKM